MKTGRTIVVTGAAGGIGKECVRRFLSRTLAGGREPRRHRCGRSPAFSLQPTRRLTDDHTRRRSDAIGRRLPFKTFLTGGTPPSSVAAATTFRSPAY